jgi:D-glycero-alpha-D-manno-heptose-7-phosphate kinase
VRIESKAPTRIDLAGGTLDIWPLYLFHEGAVTVNCAITRYASCAIETSSSRALSTCPSARLSDRQGRRGARTRPEKSARIVLISRDTKREESFPSLEALCRAQRYKLPLLAHLVRVFRPATGFTLATDSEAPAGAGIGGSSAMAVAICAALDRLTGAGLRR